MSTAGLRVIETFPVDFPNGHKWEATLYQGRSRHTARRIVVRVKSEALKFNPDPMLVLFDTDEAYDLGNATNKLDLWLTEIVKLVKPVPEIAFAESAERKAIEEMDTDELPALSVA